MALLLVGELHGQSLRDNVKEATFEQNLDKKIFGI
jgi:hypothetical protein